MSVWWIGIVLGLALVAIGLIFVAKRIGTEGEAELDLPLPPPFKGLIKAAKLNTDLVIIVLGTITFIVSIYMLDKNPTPNLPNLRLPSLSASLFQDDFSSTSADWQPLTSQNGGNVKYANGGYQIYIPPSASGFNWEVAGPTQGPGRIKDAIVEVDAQRIGSAPSQPSAWGMVCRLQDENNFYTMGIRSDGSYYISVMKNGTLSWLTLGNPSSYVHTDTSVNHIQGDCEGSKLTLYVNGRELDEVSDTSLDVGEVGLFVDNNAATGAATNVLFDNFSAARAS